MTLNDELFKIIFNSDLNGWNDESINTFYNFYRGNSDAETKNLHRFAIESDYETFKAKVREVVNSLKDNN